MFQQQRARFVFSPLSRACMNPSAHADIQPARRSLRKNLPANGHALPAKGIRRRRAWVVILTCRGADESLLVRLIDPPLTSRCTGSTPRGKHDAEASATTTQRI